MKPHGILDAFALKMLMAALMLLDHLYYFLPQMGFPIWFTGLGRLVAPTFCYLMTQSLTHTRNRSQYIGRMALAGGIMLAGNSALALIYGATLSNSIFLSLAVSATLVDALEQISLEGLTPVRIAAVAGCAFLCQYVEGGFLMPATAVIFYFLRERKALMCLVYAVGGTLVVALLMGGFATGSARYGFQLLPGLRVHVQFLQVFALVPILLYNGRPGLRNAFGKWFFYIFYPLHIWILYIVSVTLPA